MSSAAAATGLGRTVRSYVWIASAEVLAKAFGFLAFALLARRLGPTAYGALEVAVAVSMVLLLVVDFGLGATAARVMTTDPDRSDAMTGSVPTIRLGLALLAVATASLAAPWLASDAAGQRLIVWFAASLLFAPWILDWVFQGLDRTHWIAPAQLVRMGIFLLGVWWWVEGPRDLLRVGAIEIAGFAAMAGYYIVAARHHAQRPALRPDAASTRQLLRESAPVGAGQLLWVLNQYLPTFALAYAVAGDELAYYGAAHRVVFGLGSFVFLYFFTLYPALVRTTHERPEAFTELTGRSLRATGWLAAVIGVTGTVLAEPAAVFAFGDAFAASGPLLAVLTWALAIHLLSGHARFGLIAAGHPGAHLQAQACGVLVTLVACGWLIPRLGALGAALATIAAALAVWAWAHIAITRRVAPLPGLLALRAPATAALGSLGLVALWPAGGRVLPAVLAIGGLLAAGGWAERQTIAAAWAARRGGGSRANGEGP